MKNCKYCLKEINKHKVYCDNKCQREFEYETRISEWKQGILSGTKNGARPCRWLRTYIFRKFDSKCCICGWNKINPKTNKSPLEIDHIDGNCLNNKEENLRLICPNCHSLTPTWKALNKGNGNKERHKYSKLI